LDILVPKLNVIDPSLIKAITFPVSLESDGDAGSFLSNLSWANNCSDPLDNPLKSLVDIQNFLGLF
jgi:hypothetical protein